MRGIECLNVWELVFVVVPGLVYFSSGSYFQTFLFIAH